MSVKHKIILSKKQINIIFIILISVVIIVGLSYFGMKLVYNNIYSKSMDTLKLNDELFETTSEETSSFENTKDEVESGSSDKSSGKDTTSNSSNKQNSVTDNNTSTDTLSKVEKKIAEYDKIVTNLTKSNTVLKNEITELDNTILAYKKDLSEEKTKLVQFKNEYEEAKIIFRKEYMNDKNEIVYIYDEEKLKPYNEKIKNSESKIQDIDSKIVVAEKEKYTKETSIANNNKDILKYQNEIDKLK